MLQQEIMKMLELNENIKHLGKEIESPSKQIEYIKKRTKWIIYN